MVEVLVEYDSAGSGCGEDYFYGNNKAHAIRNAIECLELWCEPGDKYEAVFTIDDKVIAEKTIRPRI